MSGLGNCNRTDATGKKACNGDLCIYKDDNGRTMVGCASCRHPQPDHSKMRELAEAEAESLKAASQPPLTVPAWENAATWLQRIQTLEKQHVAALARADQQDARIAKLESELAEPRRREAVKR
jgi:hypothetical protein